MRTLLRVTAGLAGLFLLVIGLAFILAPSRAIVPFDLFPGGSAGYNTLRGDFGGLFLGMALFCLARAIRGTAPRLGVPVVILAFIVLGRLTSLVFDGASKVQRRENFDTRVCTRIQSKEKSPSPFSATTVGLPVPPQFT